MFFLLSFLYLLPSKFLMGKLHALTCSIGWFYLGQKHKMIPYTHSNNKVDFFTLKLSQTPFVFMRSSFRKKIACVSVKNLYCKQHTWWWKDDQICETLHRVISSSFIINTLIMFFNKLYNKFHFILTWICLICLFCFLNRKLSHYGCSCCIQG